jgi:hypothetical protein
VPRDRVPTISDVEELIDLKVGNEREGRQTAFSWLDGRLTRLESRVVLWGAIPTVAVMITAILAYLRK